MTGFEPTGFDLKFSANCFFFIKWANCELLQFLPSVLRVAQLCFYSAADFLVFTPHGQHVAMIKVCSSLHLDQFRDLSLESPKP